ncbi:restriction endonuclease subunit S [Micromonospora chalcea]|uniref:restriction endonuclease subunit S n=1 Tax=Micromonospora chalcea TaxID=1874 RepID=UPI00379ABDB2
MTPRLASGVGWLHSNSNRWPVVPLRLIARMGTGHTPDRSKLEYWRDCHIPWVTTPDLTSQPDSVAPLMETQQKISQLGLENSAAVLHEAGTVMLSRTASIGYSTLIGRPMATTQAFVTWSPGPLLDSRFLLYVLRAMSQEWERLAYGSTHKTIYMPDLESLRVPLPPLEEQRRIVRFLDRRMNLWDELMFARRQQLDLLSQRRRALVDGLVRKAGAAEYKLFRGLRLLRDGTHQPPARVVTGVPLLTARNVSNGVLRLTENDTHVSDEDARVLERSLKLLPGDVLLSVKGTIGAAALVPNNFPRVVLDRNVALLRASADLLPRWLLLTLRSTQLQDQMRISVSFAAQPGLPLGAIRELRLPVPAVDIQREFAKVVQREEDWMKRSERALNGHLQLLSERRQAEIAAAITGQLDVTTANGLEE